ncbi:helix-turn-helix domain-containing protein [Chryseobacterium daecheongense]|uniref:AraC family transcriptional regulator n=1 Tax=Chryseobacterium daecheongense TaxID=192389 RepID=A0A3N0VYV6_9FLAO|nr:AraC family transcriptional regulator [Chryseobacterium daecheongense]ROH97700.1 AraC family transcriptional regulator [Chryseobacterium daecheongense]TDX93140.1 AraC-like DNA-binding protein [Chryseobacterium daecheongense]
METKQEIVFDRLVYSCAFEKHRGYEEFIPEHFLGFQLSGETHAFYAGAKTIIRENTIVLVRKNQLIRTTKYPSKSGSYKFVSITLDKEVLQQYALENKFDFENRYMGTQKLFFEPDDFLHSYFLSLTPYIDKTKEVSPRLADLKIREAIELLLRCNPDFKQILFDFSEPYKIDLEQFVNQNYMFNVPIDSFAKLTGRSTSAFKRDFKKVFNCSPGQWLLNKRLEEAHYLIKYKKQKPVDFYLDLGFENLSHFYYAFKQRFGMTSSQIK